jgi:superfamily II DNA or RNA helicase
VTFKPREWQKYGADQCVMIARTNADRALIYACPGSGKTYGGLLIAKELIRLVRKTRHLLVITPNIAIRTQWIERARDMGIELREIADVRVLQQRELPIGVHGFITSYQAAVNMRHSLRTFCEAFRPVVVLDEVHHTAGATDSRDGNAWGHSIEYACAEASFKLCTTGTPFREGNNPIAFVHYNESGEAIANVRYTYEQAIRDGVCRPIEFEFYDGYVEWNRKNGQNMHADFQQQLTKRLSRERLEAALSTDGRFPLRMITAAHEKLSEIRRGTGVDSKAGGLVVAINREHADALADLMTEVVGQRPVVVTHAVDDAQALIDAFRSGDEPWIIGIGMLSEGVDIPRLRVGVYASRIRAALYFHQFCGRFVRVQNDRSERSYVFLPRDPEIEAIAIEIEKEKYHALGEDPPQRGNGHGRGSGRRLGIEVEDSDASAVANVANGVVFSREYKAQHQSAILEFRRKSADYHGYSDIQILKILIDAGAVQPPTAEAAE